MFRDSPRSLQSSIIKICSKLPYKYRYGKGYVYIQRLLETTGSFDKGQLQEFQFNQFLAIYRHALKSIPFYQRLYRKHGLDENSIKSPEDITKIPTITKNIVRENLLDMVLPSISIKKIIIKTTGGTTGQPLPFYILRSHNQINLAFIHNLWERCGYTPFDFMIALQRSNYFKLRKGIHQFYMPLSNILYLSHDHLDKNMGKRYIQVIQERQPKFLLGISSPVFVLAQIYKELNITPPRIERVFCHSQILYAGQREVIEDVFGCRVFTHYGLAEKVILAAECEYSDDYHIVPEYGYTELVNPKGEVISAPDVVGELVGTGFYNRIMPLIRYRTTDLAAYREDQSCPCARPHVILSNLKGRTPNFLVHGDGTLKGTSPGSRPFRIFSLYCRGFQLLQEVPGKVEVRIIPKSDNPPGYINIIRDELKKKFFGPIEFTIVKSSSLEKSASGKPKFLIQKLKTSLAQGENVTYFIPE